jgi:hypothetical protein
MKQNFPGSQPIIPEFGYCLTSLLFEVLLGGFCFVKESKVLYAILDRISYAQTAIRGQSSWAPTNHQRFADSTCLVALTATQVIFRRQNTFIGATANIIFFVCFGLFVCLPHQPETYEYIFATGKTKPVVRILL